MARKLSDIITGATSGALQGGSVGASTGNPYAAGGGALAGGLMGLVMGLAAEEDPEDALTKRLSNEALSLSVQEKKMVLEEVKKQQKQKKKISQNSSNYMRDFFGGARLATPAAPASSVSQRLYGVQ